MPTYGMGDAIREIRTRLGYTQEEMAFGLCTPGTLSRIENGRAIISKHVFEGLCARMPGLHHVWISCDTRKEMQRSRLCKQILLFLELRKMPEAKAAIRTYSGIKDKKSLFCRQFEWYTQAICQAILKENEHEILPKLSRALSLTLPDYQKRFRNPRKAIVLSYDEVYILSNMGIAHAMRGDPEAAFHILYFLKEYMKKQHLDLLESMNVSPMILGNFAWLLKRQGRFEEAVKQCDNGIKICCSIGKYTILPHLLCIKAGCLTASGNQKTAKKCRQQAKAVLDITEEYRGYGSFEEFDKATEPIYVTL